MLAFFEAFLAVFFTAFFTVFFEVFFDVFFEVFFAAFFTGRRAAERGCIRHHDPPDSLWVSGGEAEADGPAPIVDHQRDFVEFEMLGELLEIVDVLRERVWI